MKKLFMTLVVFALVLTVSSCGRKNEAKNLQIKSNKNNEYVIKYVKSKLDFGELYLVVKDEAVVSFYTLNSGDYKLVDYQIKIGGLSLSIDKTEEADGKNTKTTFALPNAFNLVNSKDEDGNETYNEKTISFYVKFEDKNKGTEGATDLKDDSTVTLSLSSKTLLEFLRNKTIE